MSLLLLRVDERLIHGQVVLGWGSQLHPDRYVVVDDELALSDWEQDLYRLGAGDVEVVFSDVTGAREALPFWRGDEARSLLLVRDVATLARLGAGGILQGDTVNLGGQHHGPGRTQLLTYLHLSEADLAALAVLYEEGVDVSAQDLPDVTRVSLKTLLGR